MGGGSTGSSERLQRGQVFPSKNLKKWFRLRSLSLIVGERHLKLISTDETYSLHWSP